MANRPLVPVSVEGLEDIAEALLNSKKNGDGEEGSQSINTKVNIDRTQYIQIPQKNVLIRKGEEHKGLNWEQTIYALGENGLYMPSPAIFMQHFMNVKNASEGKFILYDGNNKPIDKPEAKDIWEYLTTGHRGGCWTWFDAFFKQDGNNPIYMETNHRVVGSGNSKKLSSKRVNLDSHVSENSYVTLNFNKDGLLTAKSSLNKYKQGENIYFYSPVKDKVARFYSNSGRAFLNCSGDPSVTDSSLGVFACAGGATAQKLRSIL